MKRQEISPMQRMLNVWAIVLIIWAVYRHQFETSLPIWMDEFLIKPLIFLGPLTYYIIKHEKKPLFTSLGFTTKHHGVDIILGLAIGGLIFFSGALANYLTDGTLYSSDSAWLNQYPVWYLVTIALATAFTEQVLMQGFLLNRLLEYKLQVVKAVASTVALFVFLRIPMLFTIPDLDGYMILQILATDLFLITVVSVLFVLRRNVALPILVHAFYTMGLYFFL